MFVNFGKCVYFHEGEYLLITKTPSHHTLGNIHVNIFLKIFSGDLSVIV